MIKKPEILSPAGNLEKLIYAVNYGADAVYCALDRFGMRSAADNFTPDELKEGIAYAHAHNAKLYLTLNTMPKDAELAVLPEYLRIAEELKPDAYIVSDPGVLEYLKEYIPDAVIHLSTQANTLNAAACRFWHKNGVQRIVLARELSLSDIKHIRANTPPELELECFVHGAMCVSYSGRCLLSNYYVNRNANNGACAQPCRWKYYLYEEKRTADVIEAEQYPEGTYVFSSKDLCMIEHIPELIDAGIDSFKIEGRVKSAYYTAVITNAYKMALEDYLKDPEGYVFNPKYLDEVESVSHREYSTGYFFSTPSENANIVKSNEYIKDKAFLCTVSEFDSKKKLAKCVQRNKLSVGDNANILSPGTTGRDIVIGRMYDLEMNPISSAPHAKMEFYLEIDEAKPGDIIRGK
ncbi:MAG TPA: U32 family peptidase [Bacillota bacterium]|nr:U32 family peptidase [Bacillota bacterium]HOK68394.1 U32 family peptidase [Bacillota bacterium]HPP85167.1 U32 family peptidase [Bacillota bacterium]